MIPWLPVPANVTVPIEQQEAVPSRIDEGAAIAVAADDLTTAVVHPVKMATIRIFNKELARMSD